MELTEKPIKLAEEVVEGLLASVGAAHVLTAPEELDRYSRCTIPWQRTCGAVVFPASTEEVSKVVAVAAHHGVPLWPFSTGRNWGYGATLATDHGAIVMILERMNRILEVNEELAYAVIEPGVTYEQLNAYLKSGRFKLWADCIDGTPKGSVIGNALDRGVGETPYGDHFGNLCGLEVVLSDGEVIRTGGSLQGLRTWHTHKWGIGPYIEGLFSQSNFGIVTRAGLWLMPEPEAYNSFVFEIRDERHLPAVLDEFRRLSLQGVVTAKLHLINDFVSLTLLTQRISEDLPQGSYLDEEQLAALRNKYRIALWSCGGGLYGTRAQVKLQRSILRKSLGRYGKLLFMSDARLAMARRVIALSQRSGWFRRTVETLVGTSLPMMELAPHIHNVLQGIPTEHFIRHAYFRHPRPRPNRDVNPAQDRCGLIWFAPILPLTSADVIPYLDDCKKRFAARGFDFYVAMMLMNPRSVVCLMSIFYDAEDAEDAARANSFYDELLTMLYERGLQQYRAALTDWSRLFETAPEMLHFNNKIKAALDPGAIIAPGRYGVGR